MKKLLSILFLLTGFISFGQDLSPLPSITVKKLIAPCNPTFYYNLADSSMYEYSDCNGWYRFARKADIKNNRVTSINFTGTYTKTISLQQIYGGTKTATFTDLDNQTLSTSFAGNVYTITISNGNSVGFNVSDPTKEPIFSKGDIKTGTPVLTVDNGTARLVGGTATISITSGYTIPSTTSATSWDNKQPQLNGTGFVKAYGTTINYDNSTYEPAFSKNTAFNKNFGTTSGTVLEGRTFGSAANSNTGDFAPATSISGTQNYVSKFTRANSIGNSQIIDNGTNVLIGTTSTYTSTDKLQVNGGTYVVGNITSVIGSGTVTFTGTSTQQLKLSSSGFDVFAGIDFFNVNRNSANPLAKISMITKSDGSYLYFGTTNNWSNGITSTPLVLTPSNKVLVNTTSTFNSSDILQVNGSAYFNGAIQATTAKLINLTYGYIPYHISNVSGLGNSPIYTNGANVGIGYSSGTEITNNKLAVNGSGYFNGNVVIQSVAQGTILKTTGDTWVEYGIHSGTDQRVKAQIQSYAGGGDNDRVIFGSRSNHPLSFNVNNGEKARISTDGNFRVNNLSGTGTRIVGATSDGTLGSIANGSEGYVLKIVNGTPTYASAGVTEVYKGTWNASNNTPTLANGTGTAGWYYICSTAGTVNFGAGNITFAVGDRAYYDGSVWQYVQGISYNLQAATASVLGGVKIGSGVTVKTDGTISVSTAYRSDSWVPSWSEITAKPTTVSGFGITDAITTAHTVNNIANGTGLLKNNGTGTWSYDNSTYLTGITSTQVTAALGYTPYNSTNPSGYITSSALSGYATQSWVNGNFDNFGSWYFATNGTFYGAVASHYQLSFNNGNGISVSPSSVSGSSFVLTANMDINNMTEQTGTFSNNFLLPVYTSGAGGLNRKLSIINMESVLGTTSGTASRLIMRNSSADAYAHNFILSSDSTLKKNIIPLANTSWTNKIQFKQFQFTDDPAGHIRNGVIAQDIEKLAPELVTKDSDGKLAVSYIDLLIAKVAEMDKQIKLLQDEVKNLKSKVCVITTGSAN